MIEVTRLPWTVTVARTSRVAPPPPRPPSLRLGDQDLSHNGGTDAFVAKVNANGAGLIYAGFIGGELADVGKGIAVDEDGSAYVTGFTQSDQATFPRLWGRTWSSTANSISPTLLSRRSPLSLPFLSTLTSGPIFSRSH